MERTVDADRTRIEVLWANFEKAVAIADPMTRPQILTDLAWAREQGIPAATVMVADHVRRYLETLAPAVADADAIVAARPGSLFQYVGPAHGRGFATPPPDGLGRIMIKAAGGGADVSGDARLSHGLVGSVGNLGEAGFRKYVLALKLEEPTRFAPLLLGVAVLDFFGDGAPGEPRYRTTSWMSAPAATDAMIDAFRREVETGHLWRVLDEGERTLQDVVESVFNLLRGRFDMSVDPQADHGAGEVDLCVSRGSDACCVELKLATNPRLVHGLTTQLPRYVRSKRTTHGRYVVVCGGDGPTPDEVRTTLDGADVDDDLDVRVTVVDARARPSASRA